MEAILHSLFYFEYIPDILRQAGQVWGLALGAIHFLLLFFVVLAHLAILFVLVCGIVKRGMPLPAAGAAIIGALFSLAAFSAEVARTFSAFSGAPFEIAHSLVSGAFVLSFVLLLAGIVWGIYAKRTVSAAGKAAALSAAGMLLFAGGAALPFIHSSPFAVFGIAQYSTIIVFLSALILLFSGFQTLLSEERR